MFPFCFCAHISLPDLPRGCHVCLAQEKQSGTSDEDEVRIVPRTDMRVLVVQGKYLDGLVQDVESGTEDEDEGPDAAGKKDVTQSVQGAPLANAKEYDANGNVLHHVRPTDTLAGLSLMYGVSAQRIKEVNCILGR